MGFAHQSDAAGPSWRRGARSSIGTGVALNQCGRRHGATAEMKCPMKRLFISSLCSASLLATAVAARAQSATPDSSPFTTANLLVGVSSTSSGREPVVGGALGWDVARRLNIEMTAKWVLPDRGAETMSLTFGANVRLAPGRAVVPFLSAGVGLYKASFDSSWSDLPGFYGRRLSESGTQLQETIEFTDPALAVGGGVSVFASRHVSIRPEVEVLWVRSGSANHVVTSASVRLAYHFERRPITPAVSTRPPR